jgi:PhnB protein
MTQINAYLSFGGNCREAMTFYQHCFGGDLEIKTFGDAPGDMMPGAQKDQVMHAKLSNGGLLLMASDGLQEIPVKGNQINLNINCSSEKEINSFFEKLSEGGNVSMPLADQFWGARFGMLIDKFGIAWMLNWEKGGVD